MKICRLKKFLGNNEKAKNIGNGKTNSSKKAILEFLPK